VGCWRGICLERGADLHMAQLMPLPLTVSCFTKIRIGFTFRYRLTWVVPDQGPLNWCVLCVCVRARTAWIWTSGSTLRRLTVQMKSCPAAASLHRRPTAPPPGELCTQLLYYSHSHMGHFVVVCLEWDANDLHMDMVWLMPLPSQKLIISHFIKVWMDTFLVSGWLGCLKRGC